MKINELYRMIIPICFRKDNIVVHIFITRPVTCFTLILRIEIIIIGLFVCNCVCISIWAAGGTCMYDESEFQLRQD